MPASASPAVTLVTTPFTFCSRLTGVTVTPAAVEDLRRRTCRTGTSGAQTTTFRSGLARSATPVMPFGLPFGTMIASRFVAKITGSVPFRPASVSLSMLRGVGRGEHVGRRALR